MGEVYRARDTNLARDVALKVLPDSVAHDPERLARLEREARLLAALNHPHIAAIHHLERAEGVTVVAMEFIPGQTLAERLASGPLPIEDALAFAQQIAEALEAAHAKSIIHRDLKPANIKVTPDRHVKLLDFGLAKDLAGEAGRAAHAQGARTVEPDLTHSPTVYGGSVAGVLLGTATYMSPEQARGCAE